MMTSPSSRIHVDVSDNAYDIHIGTNLLQEAEAELAALLGGRQVVIVTDTNIAPLHLEQTKNALSAHAASCTNFILPAGEASKSFSVYEQLVNDILALPIDRQTVLVALGGGVIGDLVGFAAASLLRGLDFIQIPTSLLAQVDSSVGGKTGINTPAGKNLVGAFHQPRLVLADIGILASLPEREVKAGYAEVVKYGLLGDAAFFDWLEDQGPALARGDMAARVAAVARSVQMKADIVARDETEQGDRALLNLGHTFCHALEAATGYSDRLLHGEGVAIGCALAFELSARLGLCAQEAPSRVRAHLKAMGMKTDLADIPGDLPGPEALLELMAQDKKVVDGQLRFILARGIGEAFVTSEVPRDKVHALLEDALALR